MDEEEEETMDEEEETMDEEKEEEETMDVNGRRQQPVFFGVSLRQGTVS